MPKREPKLRRSTNWVSFHSLPEFATLISSLFFEAVSKVLSLSFRRVHSNGAERCSSACHSKQQDVNPIEGLERTQEKKTEKVPFFAVKGRRDRGGDAVAPSSVGLGSRSRVAMQRVFAVWSKHIRSTMERTVRSRWDHSPRRKWHWRLA